MVIGRKLFRSDLLPEVIIGITLPNFDEEGNW